MTARQNETVEEREARLQYLRDWRAANPDLRVRTSDTRRRRDRARAVIREIKDQPCQDCGGEFHHSAMEFDHRPGEAKTWDISRLVTRSASVPALLTEIAKCDLVCANCHRVRTWDRTHTEDGQPTPESGFSATSTANQRAARARRIKAKNTKATETKMLEAAKSNILTQTASAWFNYPMSSPDQYGFYDAPTTCYVCDGSGPASEAEVLCIEHATAAAAGRSARA